MILRSTTVVIGAKQSNGKDGKDWGSDFDIRTTLDRYQCKNKGKGQKLGHFKISWKCKSPVFYFISKIVIWVKVVQVL